MECAQAGAAVADAMANGWSGRVSRRLTILSCVFRRRRGCGFAPTGTALVQAPASEMGMGTATAQIQHAADRLGLPLHRVTFQYGDSGLPDTPDVGGRLQSDGDHLRGGAGGGGGGCIANC